MNQGIFEDLKYSDANVNLYKRTKSMNHLLVLTMLVASCVALSGCGKEKEKVYHVGIISEVDAFTAIADGFKARMTELGYMEGKNIVYDIRIANMDSEQEKQVVNEFIRDKVDLIFSFPTEASIAAKETTRGTNIPVVFANANIEGTNLIESVRHPGGNITGVRFPGADNDVMRLGFLRKFVPKAKRVLIIYDPSYPTTQKVAEALRSAAPTFGITLVENHVTSVKELQDSLKKRSALVDIGIDAILIMPEYLNHTPDGFVAIRDFANGHKIPLGGGAPFTVDQGAIFTFHPNFYETGTLAAALIDKIFKGASAGTIPVATPESHLLINYRVIKELGLPVSDGLLSRAEKIIR
jgi:putative tryptophan/tyrosine transport system substrate-binding protein